MKTLVPILSVALSATLACASGSIEYDARSLSPMPLDSLPTLVAQVQAEVQRLGYRPYPVDEVVPRMHHVGLEYSMTGGGIVYADREEGCGLFSLKAICNRVQILIVHLCACDSTTAGTRVTVTAATSKRGGLLAPYRLERPSKTVRLAADSLAQALGRRLTPP